MSNAINTIVDKQALEGLSALEERLKKSVELIVKLSQEAQKASGKLSSINTPVQLNNNNRNNNNISSQISSQSESVRRLQSSISSLNGTIGRNNRLTSEEIVNQRILRINSDRMVLANSQLAGAYRNLSAQQAISAQRLQDLISRGRLATQTQKQYNNELRNAKSEFNQLNARVLQADRAVGRFNRNVGNYPKLISSIKDLIGAFGVATGVSLIASITKDIFDQTRQLQSLDLALKQVIGTQEDFADAQSFLFRVSEQYGVGIRELTKSYTQFYVSAKDKLSASEIEGIFESISKAAGAMGLSVEQQEGAFLALTQMLSKGTIQAEELRGQLSERLPGAFGILAKSMGVTEQELNKLLKDGRVLAAEVLPAFAKELEKAYGIENLQRVESLNASTTRLSNAWTNFIRSLNEGSGAFSSFLQIGINNLTQIITLTGMLFTSNEKLRQSYLDSRKAQGESNAKAILNKIKDADEREAYANEALLKTRAEIAKNTAEFNRLKEENAKINAKTTTDSREVYEDRKILKANEERIKSLNNLIYKQVGYVNGLKAILAQQNKVAAAEKETEKEREERLKREEERSKNAFIISQQELDLRLQTISKTLDNEDMFYQERLTALELYRQVSIQKLVGQYNEEVRLAKGNQQLQIIALNKFHLESLELSEKFNKKREQLESLKPISIGTTVDIDREKQLQESAEKGIELAEREAEANEKRRLELLALQKATEEYINTFSNGFLADAGLGSLQKFFDGTFTRLMAGADTVKEKFAVTFNAISEVAKEAFNFINKASQENFDAEYRRLEMQKEVALQFAGESTSAQEEIQRQYDERKKAIQRREAEAQKRLAVFNILINTAQGVVSALASTPPNVPLSIAIGIIGAVQAGIVQSQPIPQFFEGGTHKGGLMMVNDAKGNSYKETIVTPDGKVIKPQGRNVLMNAPAGTEIFTPEQWKERENYLKNIIFDRGISFGSNMQNAMNIKHDTLTYNEYMSGISKLERSMMNMPSSHISFDERGYRKFITQKGKRTERLNRRFNING